MREVILCKYGEIILKGLNKSRFESQLIKALIRKTEPCGNFEITRGQSTVTVKPLDDFADVDRAFDECKKVFGFVSVARAVACEKNIDAICRAAREYIPPFLAGAKTFKADARRSDKSFPMTSPQISAEVGGALLEVMPYLKVDVRHPEITVMIEVRENEAYIHAGSSKGAGGLPLGSSGKTLLLLSGGIDSPVAGYMCARRGAELEALHFESFPYTSERAKEKVMTLAHEVADYAGPFPVHVVSLTKIQERLKERCNEDYFTLLLRRSMMRIADRLAEKRGCLSLATGESLGQVASQTIEALAVTDPMATRPVLRPCICLDKEDIVETARRIGTFDTSILPFEDCCTVFTPRHPKTRPEREKVEAQEIKADLASLEDEALATYETVNIE